MNPIVSINQPVDVIVSFSRSAHTNTNRVMPVKMRHHGVDISLTKLGLRYPIRHGTRLCYIFDVSDGTNDYSLEFDTTTLHWTLLSLIDGANL